MAANVQKACVACKYHRQRCDENCMLAKYFSAEKADDIENVHRLFGMQNTLKILKSVEEDERDKTMESLIMEARMRLEHPVHGHLSVARKLIVEIENTKKELEIVNNQLQLFKEGANQPQN